MKRIIVSMVLVMLLMGVAADAQKKNKPITPTPTKLLCVSDDNGMGYVVFNPVTGDFTCRLCRYGWEWSGKGTVTAQGMQVGFNCLTESYQIYLSINLETGTGKAMVELFQDPENHYDITPVGANLIDYDIFNSSVECLVR